MVFILANFYKFQIFVEQSIFVVYKCLLYKKTSIFDGKCNGIKIGQFAQVLSDSFKYKRFLAFPKFFNFGFFISIK